MSAAAAAERGRRLIESQMRSVCSIRARSTGRTTDPDTGAVVQIPGALIYSGKCRVRPSDAQATTTDAGGAEAFTFDYLVSIPFAEVGVAEGHRVTITASPDPSLVGVEVEVGKVARGEDITARRLLCLEVA